MDLLRDPSITTLRATEAVIQAHFRHILGPTVPLGEPLGEPRAQPAALRGGARYGEFVKPLVVVLAIACILVTAFLFTLTRNAVDED